MDSLSRSGVPARAFASAQRDEALRGRVVLLRTTGLTELLSVRTISRLASQLIVLVTGDLTPRIALMLVRAGAKHVLPETADLGLVGSVVKQGEADVSIVPTEMIADVAVAQMSALRDEVPLLTTDEVTWIQAVAAGKKVQEIAVEAGYSERTMFRYLDRIYRVLGVDNRIAAVAVARRLGVIESRSSPL